MRTAGKGAAASGCPRNQALLIPRPVSQLAAFGSGQARREGSRSYYSLKFLTRYSRGYIGDAIMPHATRPRSANPIIEGVGIVDLLSVNRRDQIAGIQEAP
jgi:hypothetical protein